MVAVRPSAIDGTPDEQSDCQQRVDNSEARKPSATNRIVGHAANKAGDQSSGRE